MAYFCDYFNVKPGILEEYGAFNISLITDLPLFIDPFLLYGTENTVYQQLHNDILKYLAFLRDKSFSGNLTSAEILSWYKFSEVKQNWLGFSAIGNGGTGLGEKFGRTMSSHLHLIFDDIFEEKISRTSHLEKAALFQIGVGKDNISDFTCNLIKSFLLEYTETFAKKYISSDQTKVCLVERSYFDYKIERWMAKKYTLPMFGSDYVILTPRDLLTKDENWINSHDLRGSFSGICASIPNEQLRSEVNRFYTNNLPAPTFIGKGRRRRQKPYSQTEIAEAVNSTILKFPEVINYYIKKKEEGAEKAKSVSNENVQEIETIFENQIHELVKLLSADGRFYQYKLGSSFDEALKRVHFLKDVIENKDGYRFFYYKGKPINREEYSHIIYRLTWFSTPLDVNREVNNGRGPVDYVISYGAKDKTLVEFKLATNKKLRMNLENQTKIYQKASNAQRAIKVILYFDLTQRDKVVSILKELKLEDKEEIVLIDACDNKISASNVK